MLRIILNRLQPKVEEILSEEQAGFRRGRSTTEQIFNIRVIIEKYLHHKLKIFSCFIDFKKAFDRVWHEALWASMHHYQMPKDLIEVISKLYADSTGTVLTAGQLSRQIECKTGVRQGCILSPTLFNLFLERIMQDAMDDSIEGISIGGRTIKDLRFADDIAILSSSSRDLTRASNNLHESACRYGMEISSEKSKVLVFQNDRDQTAIHHTIGNEDVEQVRQFKYLGSMMSEDGTSSKEIDCRIGIATAALAKLKPLWKDRNLSIANKIRLMKSLVASCFLYGCESWTLTKRLESRINAFEMRSYRSLLKIPYTAHRTNTSVIDEILNHIGRFERLLETIKRRKLQWFGHIVRAENLSTMILEGCVNGARGRGRPKRHWLQDITEWSRLSLGELLMKARDRVQWRKLAWRMSRFGAPTIEQPVTG